MSYQEKISIIRHFSLLGNITLFGKTGDMYYICEITKIIGQSKINFTQNEGRIFVKHDDNTHYCIEVTICTDKKLDDLDKPTDELFMSLLKKYAHKIYYDLKTNSSEMIIKEKNNKFMYHLYDIPAYIWCITVGAISAKL